LLSKCTCPQSASRNAVQVRVVPTRRYFSRNSITPGFKHRHNPCVSPKEDAAVFLRDPIAGRPFFNEPHRTSLGFPARIFAMVLEAEALYHQWRDTMGANRIPRKRRPNGTHPPTTFGPTSSGQQLAPNGLPMPGNRRLRIRLTIFSGPSN